MQPQVYFADQHHIRDGSIDPDALFVLTRLAEAGFIAYLVGGGVRDLLMHRQPKDFDISTSARPEQVKRLFRSCLLIGRRFRLAHVRFGRKVIEVSTFRAGEPDDPRLIVRDNVWGTPDADVLRRDFTINGLFYDPSDHKIIDYVGGYADLTKHLLRSIGPAEVRFVQDPVRMLRCLKFKARFGFHIDPPMLDALQICREELLKSSPARLLEELLRMLESGAAKPFFELIEKHAFLALLFPNLASEMEGELGESIYGLLHAADDYVTNRQRDRPPPRATLVCCLLYPLLEARVQKLDKPNLGLIHHEAWGVINDILDTSFIPFPRRMRSEVAFILECQYRLTPVTARRIRRGRIANHSLFRKAMQLFAWRAVVNPDLKEEYQEWKKLRKGIHS